MYNTEETFLSAIKKAENESCTLNFSIFLFTNIFPFEVNRTFDKKSQKHVQYFSYKAVIFTQKYR